jgi:hypothetical protein
MLLFHQTITPNVNKKSTSLPPNVTATLVLYLKFVSARNCFVSKSEVYTIPPMKSVQGGPWKALKEWPKIGSIEIHFSDFLARYACNFKGLMPYFLNTQWRSQREWAIRRYISTIGLSCIFQ